MKSKYRARQRLKKIQAGRSLGVLLAGLLVSLGALYNLGHFLVTGSLWSIPGRGTPQLLLQPSDGLSFYGCLIFYLGLVIVTLGFWLMLSLGGRGSHQDVVYGEDHIAQMQQESKDS